MSDLSSGIATQTGSSGLTDLTLAVRIDGVPDQEVFLQHGLSIGRNPSNTICVPDPLIERIHAQVCRQADGTMLLECTADHLRIQLADDSEVFSLPLKAGTTFKLGKAVIRCLKRETKPTVVVADNPWEVRCPRCHGVIADLPHDASRCPHCQIEIQFFQSHAGQPSPTAGGTDVRPASDFEGWLPRQIGPYRIRAFVAQGGMGIILRGLHQDLDVPAAVKILKVDSDDDPTWRQRFMAEIDTLKTLKHPNVVRLQDHGQDDKLLWLAMDWIDGLPLTKLATKHRAEGQNVPIDLIRQVLLQVITGLKYLHDKKIIHRDLKPSNILMAQDDLVKMVDFGIARGASGQTSVVTQMTHTGMVAGTESYMSPEQAEGQTITPASDIYSLGVVWYELVTGRRPVGAFAAPHLLRDDCPASWSHTISQCLSVDPRARPALDRLSQVLSGAAGMEPPPLPGQRGVAGGKVPPPTGVIASPPTGQKPWSPPPPPPPSGLHGAHVATGSAPGTNAPPPPMTGEVPAVGGAGGPSSTGAAYVAGSGDRGAVVAGPGVPPPSGASIGGTGQAPPPQALQQGGNSAWSNAAGTAGDVAKKTGQAIAGGASAAFTATRGFFQRHPPGQYLAKLGPVGAWINAHKGPAAAIAGAVFLILLVLIIRACSSDNGYTYTPPVNNAQQNEQNNAINNLLNQGNRQNLNPQTVIQAAEQQRLSRIYLDGVQKFESGFAVSRQEGWAKITQAADAGYPPAKVYMASIYGNPANAPSGFYNPQKQVQLLREAARAGNADAVQQLRRMGLNP